MRNHLRHIPISRWAYALSVVAILLAAATLRFAGLDWDKGTHLHPDERYLTMVVSAVRFPGEGGGLACQGPLSCLWLYWDTDTSPLNPANHEQFAGYVYGTLPLFVTRAAAQWVDRACSDSAVSFPVAPLARLVAQGLLGGPAMCMPGHYTGYGGIHLVGRGLSAMADLATLLGLVVLAQTLYGRRVALVAGALYATAALPIQHAHFFVVDSFATVFVVWTLTFSALSLRRRNVWWLLPAGLTTGLAVASKVSVWPLAGIVALTGLVRWLRLRHVGREPRERPATLIPKPRTEVRVGGPASGVPAATIEHAPQISPGGEDEWVTAGPASDPEAIVSEDSHSVSVVATPPLQTGVALSPTEFTEEEGADTPDASVLDPAAQNGSPDHGTLDGVPAVVQRGARSRRARTGRKPWTLVVALVLSGLLAALAFRSAQPYAFSGPRFLDVIPHPRWMATMEEIQQLMRGLGDVPFGHQWTARTPIVFPWRNMVFWGLGLPLGLMAWAGWVWMGGQMLFRRRLLHLIPWAWGTVFFLYQATQWVKSMRYLLPVYPVFALFAAWAAVRMARGRRWTNGGPASEGRSVGHRVRRVAGVLGKLVLPLTLAGALLWAFAFHAIYAQPVTRITASEWMFRNIPTAITVETTDGESINVPLAPDMVLSPEKSSIDTRWRAERDVEVAAIVLPKVRGVEVTGPRTLAASLETATAQAAVTLDATDTTPVRLVLDHPVRVSVGEAPLLELELTQGAAVQLDTSVVANEHWDDPLPLRLEGRDPFWNWYRSLSSSPGGQMNNYDNDTLEKRANLLAWLNEADVIVLSSNRLSASIPRLPARYPLTTEYYRLLFDGSLGFELATEFVSYPALGPCQFPDQEIPFPLMAPKVTNARPCSVPYPPAEEAFSVYDHPTVLIFTKTAAYSPARAAALLPASLVENVRWMTPREATLGADNDSDSLLMSARTRQAQERGGTWSKLFNREALQNRAPQIAVGLWAVMLTVIGWIAYPLVYAALPNLRHRGYGFSRIVGLLLWSYLAWLLASVRILPHTRATLWLVLGVLALISGWAAYRQRAGMKGLISRHWRQFLTIDGIFLALYLVWVGVRWMNPDLWHPTMGGEKPMDFAYLNAVIKSTWFPPYDPWFAGGHLNYYYFGFVMVGSLVKLLGTVPSVAYNLAVPALFALTGVGGYALASNLAGGSDRRGHRAGLWGVLMVVILGNLGEAKLLYTGFRQVGNVDFDSLIPGYPNLVSTLAGIWKVVVDGVPLPFRTEWWYWNASRAIPVLEGEVGPINEFPAFTFLYADLHAHMMALPLTQAALGIAIQWGVGAHRWVSRMREGNGFWSRLRRLTTTALPTPIGSLLLAGLITGALRATNTWDYPTYLALISASYLIGVIAREFGRAAAPRAETPPLTVSLADGDGHDDDPASASVIQRPSSSRTKRLLLALATPVTLLVTAEVLFRPFTAAYEGAYAALELWTGSRTPAATYVLMYGLFLFPIALGALAGLAESAANRVAAIRQMRNPDAVLWPAAILMTVLIFMVLLIGYLDAPVAWLAVPLGGVATLLLTEERTPLLRRLLWFWVGTALALSLLVEVAVLKGDIGRMNTVFKFHLQVWMLLAVGAAVFVERLLHSPLGAAGLMDAPIEEEAPASDAPVRAGEGGGLPTEQALAEEQGLPEQALPWWARRLNDLVLIGMALLVFTAALYPLFAIPGRIRDRWTRAAPRTLDGMAYMPHVTVHERGTAIPLEPDHRVIRWLQENVEGSPTIIEAAADVEYRWSNRMSIYTGLPSVAGWRWHQVQQRMVMPAGTVEARQQDIRVFYSTGDPQRALDILTKYQVSYVILTPYERAYMIPEGLPKFATMVEQGWLEIAYRDDASTVYRVTASGQRF